MKKVFVCVYILTSFLIGFGQDVYMVETKEIKAQVPPTLWGLFFEDINRSADGGIYADLIKNRSFDFPDAFMGWQTVPARYAYAKNEVFQIINQSAIKPNDPKYIQVTVSGPGNISLSNEGFGGVTVEKGKEYVLILVWRQKINGLQVDIDIVNASGKSIASTTFNPEKIDLNWQTTKIKLVTTDSTIDGKLKISFTGTGQLDIDRVSLFPKDTWMNRHEGLRKDLVEKLAAIHPGFMRFPGGCIVEGKDIENRYQWKNTIGPLASRKLILNQWQDGAAGKPLPDYFQSFGLGFYEYFQLCEDLKAAPLPILNCGLSCQFGAGEVVAVDQIDPYVQDALDLIEFANGDANSVWGKKRIEMGHPAPFHMKMLGVGNENWGPQYLERLKIFTRAIKSRYPDVQLICSSGYTPNAQFKYIDSALRKEKVDIIDEHYYQTVPWFLMNAGMYDHYDRKGPKIFIGEYACHSIRIGNPGNKNTQLCALAEAAFMTGVERNADIVTMAAYAPLFAHVTYWQWTPNLIWFDNSTSYATPSYYVQQLFSVNKGTDVVRITENGHVISGSDSVWASAVIDRTTNEVIIKLVNPSSTAKQKTIEIPGLAKKETTATVTVLKNNDPQAVNSIADQWNVKPVSSVLKFKGRKTTLGLAAYSFSVIKIKN